MLSCYDARDYENYHSSLHAMKRDADAGNGGMYGNRYVSDYQKGAYSIDSACLAIYDQDRMLNNVYGKQKVSNWDNLKKHEVYKHLIDNIVKLTLANGITVEITEGHPLLCKGAFKTICDDNEDLKLKVGDEVYTIKGYSEIVSIEYLIITTNVYNLNVIDIDEVDDVDTYDNFFANGICVHNIAPVDEYPREPQGYQYQDVPIHSGGSND